MKKGPRKSNHQHKHHETLTYKLNDIKPDPGVPRRPYNPFTLPMREPGWFPDGIKLPWAKLQTLFPEEVIGMGYGSKPIPFGVQFCEQLSTSSSSSPGNARSGKPKKKNYPHQWILGIPIQEPKTKAAQEKKGPMNCLVCDLAKRIRKYNASLYRLRRLHYWFMYSSPGNVGQCKFPTPNPYGDIKDLPDPISDESRFRTIVQNAEDDWIKVTSEVRSFIDEAVKSYPFNSSSRDRVALMAADMVEVNGYVVSMRVVAQPLGMITQEHGGSSSHVSISSAFSSY